jgi:alkylation response protein AidB-like acyl-CoA dehydrogenase
MDLELSDEQEHLAEGLRGTLEGSGDVRRVRSIAYEGDGRDPELWEQLASNGWTSAMLPESAGGMGLGFEEAMLIAIEAGRGVLHLPLCETLLATRAGARSAGDVAEQLLARIAEGAAVALAVGPAATGLNDADDGVRATPDGTLRGNLRSVPFGPLADHCLVAAELADGSSDLFVMACDAARVTWTARRAMDETVRRFDLQLENAPAARLAGAADALERLLDEWRVLLASQSEGAARRLVEMTADYVKKREQFGRPVGANQAIKVRVAEMGAAVERMRAAIYFAALAIEDDHPERALAVAMAKAEAGAPGSFVGTQAIHSHGAIGYTWEQDVHLFVKRLKSNELLLGTENEMLARIADIVVDAPA